MSQDHRHDFCAFKQKGDQVFHIIIEWDLQANRHTANPRQTTQVMEHRYAFFIVICSFIRPPSVIASGSPSPTVE